MKKNINDEYRSLNNQSSNNYSLQEKLVSASNNNINPNNTLDKSIESSNNTKILIQKKSIYSTNSNKPKSYNFRLSRNVRWFIFCILVLVTIMINMDHGTIPAATEEIKESLKLGDDDLGYFGSLVFLGNIIGSLLSFSIINWINRKYLLLISLVLNSVLLFVFTLTDIKWILFIVRVLVGIFQSFISIYMPVWCDQFGIKKRRPIMISIIQSGSPLGVVFGYLLTAYIKTHYIWTYSFQIQAVFSGVLAFIILFVPVIYFSSTLNSDKPAHAQNEETFSCRSNSKARFSSQAQISNQARLSGNFSVYQDTSVIIGNQANGFFSNFTQIVKQRVFLLSALALSNLFFIITAIQYWASGYEKQVLGVADENQIFLSFAIVCITSPTLGLFFGGIVSAKTGGYEAKHSILVCFVFGLLAGIAAIPVPMTNDIFYFTLYLWLVLFFGGAILPNLIGIIITSLPHHLRGSVNSMTNLITNLFGYLPAPAVYGLIFEKYKETNNRLAMQVIIYSSFIGSILLVFAMYFRYMQRAKDELMNVGQDRKTSILSANSNLTNNLAKLYNPNCALNVNYEKGFDKENNRDEASSSSNSDHSGDLNESDGNKKENCSAKSGRDNSSSGNSSKIKKKDSSKSNNNSSGNSTNKKKKGKAPNDDVPNYLSSNKIKEINRKKSYNKGRKDLTNSPSRNSFDVTLVEENSEIYNSSSHANMLVGKNYSQSAINNISMESKNNNNNNKKDRSVSSNKNSDNGIGISANYKASANPNFNYNKYLEENVFNQTENEASNLNSHFNLNAELAEGNNENSSNTARNKRKLILNEEADSNLNKGVSNSKNNYGKNYSYLNNSSNNTNNNNNNLNLTSAYLNPVSIKTPNFNFVGNSSNENCFLEEKDRLGNFPNLNQVGSHNGNSEYLGHGTNFALNRGGASNKENETEIQNKLNNNKNGVTNSSAYESSEDNKMKFSYESADNNRSEYSLFNPIKNNLGVINKNFENKNNFEELSTPNVKNHSDKEKALQSNQNNKNTSLFIGKSNVENEILENNQKLASYEHEEILISEQSVDLDNLKYNQDASNSFKKFDDYI